MNKAAVIIAAYNKHEVFRNVLTGLMRQKVSFPWELCIADDGSDVDLWPIIKETWPKPQNVIYERIAIPKDSPEWELWGSKKKVYSLVSDDVDVIVSLASDVIMLDNNVIQKLCEGVGERKFTMTEVFTKKVDPDMYKNFDNWSNEMLSNWNNFNVQTECFCGKGKPTRWYMFLGALRRKDIDDIDFFNSCDVIYSQKLGGKFGRNPQDKNPDKPIGRFTVNYPDVRAVHQMHVSEDVKCHMVEKCRIGCRRTHAITKKYGRGWQEKVRKGELVL